MQNLPAKQQTTFQFGDAELRAFHEPDENGGKIFIVAADLAEVLGYKLASDMCKMLDEDEAGMHSVHTRSENGVEQMREMTVVTESGTCYV